MDSYSLGDWGTLFHKNYYDLSLQVAPVDESIDILARAFSSGIPYLEDENGELSQEDPLIQFLLKPNKDQNFKEFAKDFVRNLYASGYAHLLPTSKNTAFTRRLDRLESENRPELKCLNTDCIDYPVNDSDDFVYTENNKQEPFSYTDILAFWDKAQNPKNHRIGVSRLCSLKDEVTNVILANRAKTNKIKQSGKFLVTPKTSALQNQIGLQLDQPVNIKKPDYKQRDFIEDKLRASGFASGKSITVTNKEMGVTNVTESIQGYSYDDEIKEDKRTIKNDFTIPRELQNIGDDQAKYSDRKEAYLELFTLSILPLATNFTETIQNYYAPKEKKKLVLDYSHHPAFEIVENKKEEKIASQVERLVLLHDKEIITTDQLNEKLRAYEII